MNEDFSIVIPTLNSEKFLGKTLESIKNLHVSELRRENLCGYDVIQLFIKLSGFHNWKFKDFNYNTSYRVNHEEYTQHTNSVGYGSMIFTR